MLAATATLAPEALAVAIRHGFSEACRSLAAAVHARARVDRSRELHCREFLGADANTELEDAAAPTLARSCGNMPRLEPIPKAA